MSERRYVVWHPDHGLLHEWPVDGRHGLSERNARDRVDAWRLDGGLHIHALVPLAELEAMENELKELREWKVESLWGVFNEHTYASERKDYPSKDGWRSTDAISATVYACDELVELGLLEHAPNAGYGRVQFYRIIARAEGRGE